MYTSGVPPVPYSPPWDAPFEQRIVALSRGENRVAYFYEKPDTSTFRYRIYNMIQALSLTSGRTSGAWFDRDDFERADRLDRVLGLCDVLVICRARYTGRINRMVTRARARGCRVLFDVDDLVFDPAYLHLIVETLDVRTTDDATWDWWFAYIGRLGATLDLCDAAIATNDALGARVAAFSGKPVHIVPNFLNREQTDLSRAIMDAKRESGFARDGRIHLGYFSGTPTHNRDFEIVSDALARLMDDDPRLVVRVAGFMEGVGKLEKHRDRMEFFPLQDFLNLQRLLGESEVNLIPLQDNAFTNCKSELKYFEAAAVGAISVATPTGALRDAIVPGVTGYLATALEWEETLRAVIRNLDDHREMIDMAERDALDRYAPERQGSVIETVLFGPEYRARIVSGSSFGSQSHGTGTDKKAVQ